MDAVTLTQQQQQTASIQGESFLAEKEKEKVSAELQHLQIAREIEFKEYNAQKAVLTKAVEVLKVEKVQLEADVKVAGEKYDGIIRSINEYGENEVEKAKNAVTSIYLTAQILQREWKDKVMKADVKAEELEKREQELNELNIAVEQQRVENEVEENLLKKREYQLTLKQEIVKKTVAQLEEKRDTLISEVETNQAKLRGVRITIKIQEDTAAKTVADAEIKLREANIKMAETKALEEKNNETSKNLAIEKLQLDDYAATIRRAYRETMDRGGKIDG